MKNPTYRLQVFAGIVLFVSTHAVAQDKVPEVGIVDELHGNVSERLSDFIGEIDNYFGGDEATHRVNESWARVRLDTIQREGDNLKLKVNLKFKAVLPNSEKRLRILFSSDEEDIRGTDGDAASAPSNTGSDQGDVSLALRFLRTIRTNSSLKFDLGARVRNQKAQVFFRVGGYARYKLDDNWWGTVSNDAVYYSASGFENTLTFKFDRYIDSDAKVLFLSATKFDWENEQKGAFISETLGLYRELSSKRSLAVEARAGVQTARVSGEHRYLGTEFRLRFRHNVWRHWFYYEIWPSMSWPSDRDYEATYGALVRVEAIIGQRNGQ